MTCFKSLAGVAGIFLGVSGVLGCGGGSSGSGTGGTTGSGGGTTTGAGGAATTGAGGGTTTGAGGTTTTGAGGATTTGAGGTTSTGAGASGGATGSGGSALTGRGGATATGAGGGAASGSGGASAVGACPSNAIFCADFENGSIPAAATFYPAYLRPSLATYMTVDASVGANGSGHSLKITPGTFSQMLGVPTGVSSFWTRVYIRTDVDTSMVTGHDTFVAGVDNSANGGTAANAGDPNNGIQLRVGEHECQLELNRNSDDKEILSDAVNGNSNYTCAGGVAFAKDTWYCLEIFYDGPNSTIRVFVDDSEVTGLHVANLGPYTYDMFKFGFENYGGTLRNVWYDDVAIAPAQVHCYPN